MLWRQDVPCFICYTGGFQGENMTRQIQFAKGKPGRCRIVFGCFIPLFWLLR